MRELGLFYKHRVAVAEEAVIGIEGVGVGGEDPLARGERADEHQQRRARQVEVRDERAHHLERERWVDEKIGPVKAQGGALGVGRATRQAVRDSIILVIILNYFITWFFYRQ